MIPPSISTYLSGARARFPASGVLALVAVACTFAFCVSPQAGAQTRGAAGSHMRRVGARAHKAACSTHSRHGSHGCSLAKTHRHKTKAEDHRRHATGSRPAPARGKVQTTPAVSAPALGGSAGATCSDGIDATLDEEGSFACANGAEPGCQEGFAPIVADDGSTLVCEPEQSETGGEEEG